jgi:MFS family permease
MVIAGILGSLVLLGFIATAPFVIAENVPKRFVRRLTAGPTTVGAFVSGALIGVFAGFIPACIAYAASNRGWAAGLALAACSAACGIAWCRFERRALSLRRRPASARFSACPNSHLRKLDQIPARFSDPPAI